MEAQDNTTLEEVQEASRRRRNKFVSFVTIPLGVLLAAGATAANLLGAEPPMPWWFIVLLGVFPTTTALYASARILP